ncbi:hypothetical protein A9Q81_10510 [Gammaproteobacteria bacterium 42_54_T18]|nr:hypothetical protein A9Q81_10510 [Gammaproteobacteria bacterium 42_54_T18]
MILYQEKSTIGSWSLMMTKVLEHYGLDSASVFDHFGLVIHQLRKNNVRLGNQRINSTWQHALTLTQDRYISIQFSKMAKPFSFNILGLCMEVTPHAHEALEVFERHAKYFNEGLQVNIAHTQTDLILSIDGSASSIVGEQLNVEAVLGTIKTILMSSHRTLKLRQVNFQHSITESPRPFEVFFGCPVQFSAKVTSLIFDKESSLIPSMLSNQNLALHLEGMIKKHLHTSRNNRISDKISSFITRNNAYKLDQEKLASHFYLGKRSLQRRLQQEGVSYKSLLDNCRRKKAIILLYNHRTSLSEAADILGFGNPSNFSRAFKRWYGATPGQYQKECLQFQPVDPP